MTANSVSFMDQLKESGLLAEDQLAEVRGRIASDSVEACISGLMQRGWLTEFQVQQLHAGQSKGLVLGQYHILEELGRGGYGCVYKARHKLMERIVALKVMAPDLVADPRARTWFRREVLAATHLTHPNIALAYDANEVNDVLFFAMEFIDGLNLDTLVRQRGPLPINMACELIHQVAKALQYAQEKGMVHRDIKPANLLIPRSAVSDVMGDPASLASGIARPVIVKVVDFGLARLQKTNTNHTLQLQNEKSFVGTPAYVSPEQARNVHDVDIRSDLYSLGCTMYYAIAGQAPFRADTPLQLIVQHLEKEPEPLERARPEIPPALASIVRRLMAKKREKRFQTPAELIAELGFFYSTGSSAPLPAPSYLRVEPEHLPAPKPYVPLATPKVKNAATFHQILANADATRAVPGLATDLPEASSEMSRTAAINHSSPTTEKPARLEPHEITKITPQPNQRVDEPQLAQTVANAEPAPSVPCEPIASNAFLVEAWRDWHGVVAQLAAGASPGVTGAAYRLVHRSLLDECEKQRRKSIETERVVVERIIELAQPWMTLESLPTSDPPTLASLNARCTQMDRHFGKPKSDVWVWFVLMLVLVGFGIAGKFAFDYLPDVRPASIMAFVQTHPFVALVGVVPLVVAVAYFFVRRVRA